MLLSPRYHSTLADLCRLVAVWLAIVLAAQGLAAVVARSAGPLHQHRAPPGLVQAAQLHHHDGEERHHHAPGDGSVRRALFDPAAQQDALDAAASALVAAFSLLAAGRARTAGGPAAHVLRPAPAWAFLTGPVPVLSKPPQRG
jgi:hypothetical protein